MIIQTVRSDDGGREGKWIALSITLILAVATLLLPYHQAAIAQQAVKSYQISIKDLDTESLAMIAELRLAHEEIRNIYQDGVDFENREIWADISELEALWIAPFIQDKSWERKGKHAWSKVAPAFYQGIPELDSGTVSTILHTAQADPDIWLNLSRTAKPFMSAGSQLDKAWLMNAGWKQVVFANADTPIQLDTTNHQDEQTH
ncbi:hypothetical protein L4D77_28105 [Photobacterium frigidiphilum]|uniref:DUF6162 family protein n=1 Tax=Photobacterium frigidiphilum TaxID=264736 RepID=UPI003D0D2AB8